VQKKQIREEVYKSKYVENSAYVKHGGLKNY